MTRALLWSVLDGTVLVSTLASLAAGWLLLRQAPPREGSNARAVTAVACHPLAQFLLVALLLYVNQVFFSAFILRAHGGSTAFIGRYIPGGWFAIGRHDPVVGFVARHVGDGVWLSPSLLRVQAFLELPFTMFAYLAVARMLGHRLYAVLCRPLLLALVAVTFSVTFSIIELALPNPYTHDDLVLRGLSCLSVPVYVAWTSRRQHADSDSDGPSGLLGLLAFLAGAGAIAYAVLAFYDAFLLYNLAHLPRYGRPLTAAVGLAVAASYAAPRVDGVLARWTGTTSLASPALDACVSSLRVFTALFFAPSLALRYGGAHPSAVLCGALLVAVGLVVGTVMAIRRARPSGMGGAALVIGGTAAVGAGGVAVYAAIVGASSAALPELVLARGALSFLGVAIVVLRGVEIAVCWASHETKAPADEA